MPGKLMLKIWDATRIKTLDRRVLRDNMRWLSAAIRNLNSLESYLYLNALHANAQSAPGGGS